MILELTPDELLTTTRCVRRRLDLARPVEREVLEDCLRLAQQAPTASYREDWHFVVVTDAATRQALGDLWREGGRRYLERGGGSASVENLSASRQRLLDSVMHLYEHIHEVPVHVIPCIEGRTDGKPGPVQSGKWSTICPAAWSFMLAARSRGLGTCWTSFHLFFEREAAGILGLPYDGIMQAALIPTAYTIGTDFKPAARKPLDTMVHWDRW
jgi:nitroreductase